MNYIVSYVLPNEKLPEIHFANVTIKDSINFLPMALSKSPKYFDLIELKKGYFSRTFSIP
jgi:hypothetical protein